MAAERGRRSGLDQPLEPRRLTRPSIDPEAAGKISERIARFLGSWRFIHRWLALLMLLFVIAHLVVAVRFAKLDWPLPAWIVTPATTTTEAAP